MSFSETFGSRAKGSRLCVVVSALIFVVVAAAADEPIRIFEPSPLYEITNGSCRYYDVVQHEPLTFNVTASCGSCGDFALAVLKENDIPVLQDGGACIIDSCTDSCSFSCTAMGDEGPTAESRRYTIAADLLNGHRLQGIDICVRVQDVAWVRFVGEQPINVTSGDGRADLSFSADGYPQPLSYELSCSGLPPQSRMLSSSAGNFTLVELPDGVTSCTAVAYTRRRLAVTELPDVLIRVNASSLVVVAASSTAAYSSATAGISSAKSSLSASSSTASMTIEVLPVLQQDSEKGTNDEKFLVAITVPCAVVVIAVAFSVGIFISFRRRRARKGSPVISANSSVPTTPCESLPSGHPCLMPATVINNSITNHNHYGDKYEFNGPGSSVVIINDGAGRVRPFEQAYEINGPGSSVVIVNDKVGNVGSSHMLYHDDRDTDEQSTASHSQHVQEVGATCCQPSWILRSSSASMLCSVELTNDETAVKYPSG